MDKERLDIVNLINNSPLTKLSKGFHSTLLKKIQESFTNEDQQIFVASFYSYLKYNSKTDFVIDLDDVWKWCGFTRKDHCKRTLEKHFTRDVDYKSALPNWGERKNEGGFNKEFILMNIETFKGLCMIAGTSKSKEIRQYYLKLEELMHETLNEETKELKMQLQIKNEELSEKETEINKKNIEIKKSNETNKHKILLREFSKISNIVYIIKVKTFENGNYIIKIGESRQGILGRYNEHKNKYEECVILDCFNVKRSKDFENLLHSKLNKYKYEKLENHKNEKELFLVGNELRYNHIINIINNEIKKYNDDQMHVNKLELEIEKLKLENECLKLKLVEQTQINEENIIKKIMDMKNELNDNINKLYNKIENKTVNNFGEELKTLGPRVQQLNHETLNLISIHESMSNVCKIFKCPRSSIIKAAKENTIYLNYRWNLIEREDDPYNLSNIKPTKILQKNQKLGYIAKLNKDKTEILNVYLDRKTASIKNGYDSVSYLDVYVKNGKETNGFYYKLFEECEKELIDKFINKNGNIILYKNGVGKYNLENELVEEFKSKYDCQFKTQIGNKSLCKALETGKSYNNYFYKYLNDKIMI